MPCFQTNWDLQAIIMALVLVPLGLAFGITRKNYTRNKNTTNALFMLAWLCYVIWGVNNLLILLYPPAIVIFQFIPSNILMAFFVITFLDLISRNAFDPVKFSIVSALSGAKILAGFDPNAQHYVDVGGGELVLQNSIAYTITSYGLLLFTGLCYLYYMYQIHHHAPRNLKKFSGVSLLGAILMGIGGPVLGVFVNDAAAPVIGMGVFLTAWSFYKHPQLVYILPFKAYRLVVFETVGGIDLFMHTWNEEQGNLSSVDLFTPILQGIGGILQEILNKGGLQEIHLDKAILLIHRSPTLPFTSVLVTTKSSPYLRQSLKNFTEKFEERFGGQFPRVHDVSIFSSAESLVAECFPYLPKYD